MPLLPLTSSGPSSSTVSVSSTRSASRNATGLNKCVRIVRRKTTCVSNIAPGYQAIEKLLSSRRFGRPEPPKIAKPPAP
eukprot:865069-Amphidinium_carterae.1